MVCPLCYGPCRHWDSGGGALRAGDGALGMWRPIGQQRTELHEQGVEHRELARLSQEGVLPALAARHLRLLTGLCCYGRRHAHEHGLPHPHAELQQGRGDG
eukprot:10586922-Alexandrium_andersonii.AAC.1